MRYPARFGTGSRNRALDGLGISDLLTRSPAMNVPRIELLSSGPFERSACFSGRRSVAFCNRRVTVHEVQRFLPLRGPDLPGKEAGQDQDHDRHLHRPRAPKASRATRSISAAARAKRAICGYSCTTLRTRIRRAHARFITQIAARAHCRGLMLAAGARRAHAPSAATHGQHLLQVRLPGDDLLDAVLQQRRHARVSRVLADVVDGRLLLNRDLQLVVGDQEFV